MGQGSQFPAAFLVFLFVLLAFEPLLSAQTAPAPLTPQQLDQLLSPIALYPDSLLSQIMIASTNPQEILDVDNWVYQNPGLSGTALADAAQHQGFDPAFIALVNFPQVLETMAQHIDDYAAVGEAFSADQAAVTDSIQRLRAQAYAAGSLRSNAQQVVEVQQASGRPIYVIQPANPQVVYVPQYDPTVVYARPSSGMLAAPLMTFGAGITLGALLGSSQPWGWGGWGWNWGARRANYNHGAWAGWARPYRPPRVWYRQRPIVWTHRPGFGGNWNYRPPNYRPSRPGNRPGYGRPPYGPNNWPGFRPPGNRAGPSRPGISAPRSTPLNRPRASQPRRPGTRAPSRPQPPRPGTRVPNRPQLPRPSTNRRPQPANPNRPAARPANPRDQQRRTAPPSPAGNQNTRHIRTMLAATKIA